MHGDCDNVVRDLREATVVGANPRKVYAGVVRQAWKEVLARTCLADARKVRAHQDLDNLVGDEWRLAYGNSIADDWAKKAVLRHPPWASSTREVFQRQWDDAVAALVHLARASARWPARKAVGRAVSIPRTDAAARRRAWQAEVRAGRARARVQAIASHDWVHWRDHGRCTQCLVRRESQAATEACGGQPEGLADVIHQAPPMGHRLWVAEAVTASGLPTPLVACNKCGAWSQMGLPRLLAKQCAPPTRGGAYQIDRMRRGFFPRADRRFEGWRLEGLMPFGRTHRNSEADHANTSEFS